MKARIFWGRDKTKTIKVPTYAITPLNVYWPLPACLNEARERYLFYPPFLTACLEAETSKYESKSWEILPSTSYYDENTSISARVQYTRKIPFLYGQWLNELKDVIDDIDPKDLHVILQDRARAYLDSERVRLNHEYRDALLKRNASRDNEDKTDTSVGVSV